MRFSTIILSAALATLSVAQSSSGSSISSAAAAAASSSSSSSSSQSSTTKVAASVTYSLTPAQSSQAACLAACPANDPNCRAKCIVVDEGDYSQQNRTIDCISECPKGNGTAIDNLNFENCQKGCLKSATITPASTSAPTSASKGSSGAAETGASNSGETGSAGSNSGASKTTGGSSGSPTGSAATTSKSGSAADNVHIPVIGAFIGLGSLAIMFGL